MIQYNLDKDDLVNLVSSMSLPYELIDQYARKGYGDYCGGFNDKWTWNKTKLETLPEQQLLTIYEDLKEYWKKY